MGIQSLIGVSTLGLVFFLVFYSMVVLAGFRPAVVVSLLAILTTALTTGAVWLIAWTVQ